MKEQQLSPIDISKRSGLSRRAIHRWLTGHNSPKLENFRAVLNTLGYDLKIVKGKEYE